MHAVVIAAGNESNVIEAVLRGDQVGTMFLQEHATTATVTESGVESAANWVGIEVAEGEVAESEGTLLLCAVIVFVLLGFL